jgi:hypothetical protein
MGSGFDQREEGFETQFKLEEEQKFRATARRNKMLGHWAGEQFGLSGADLDAYVLDVVKSDFVETGDDDVLRKVLADFEAKGKPMTGEELRKVMDKLYQEACREVTKEG